MSEKSHSRLGNCQVCEINLAKYTCPRCEIKSCCLNCVKIHKKALDCSGIRDPIKFKAVSEMNNSDLQSDYFSLNKFELKLHNIAKQSKILKNSTCFTKIRMKIKKAAASRSTYLYYLPKTFSRHKENTTYYDWSNDKIFWKVQWVFPEAEMFSVIDEKISETEVLFNVLEKYIDDVKCSEKFKESLTPYFKVDKNNIRVLLQFEKFGVKNFVEVDINSTIMENLSKQAIIEHPIFHVIFEESSKKYNITKRVDTGNDKFSSNFRGTNLLADSGN